MQRFRTLFLRHRLVSFLAGLVLLVAAIVGAYLLSGRSIDGSAPLIGELLPGSPAEKALDRAAAALATSDGYQLSGSQETQFSGPGVPEDMTFPFEVSYAAPDALRYDLSLPGPQGDIKLSSISVGDKHWQTPPERDEWLVAETPLANGFDLQAAQLLPEFLRTATVSGEPADDVWDDQPAIHVAGRGESRFYPTAIGYGMLEMTAPTIDFEIWLDPNDYRPLHMTLDVQQAAPGTEGVELAYALELTWRNYDPPAVEAPDSVITDPGHK